MRMTTRAMKPEAFDDRIILCRCSKRPRLVKKLKKNPMNIFELSEGQRLRKKISEGTLCFSQGAVDDKRKISDARSKRGWTIKTRCVVFFLRLLCAQRRAGVAALLSDAITDSEEDCDVKCKSGSMWARIVLASDAMCQQFVAHTRMVAHETHLTSKQLIVSSRGECWNHCGFGFFSWAFVSLTCVFMRVTLLLVCQRMPND